MLPSDPLHKVLLSILLKNITNMHYITVFYYYWPHSLSHKQILRYCPKCWRCDNLIKLRYRFWTEGKMLTLNYVEKTFSFCSYIFHCYLHVNYNNKTLFKIIGQGKKITFLAFWVFKKMLTLRAILEIDLYIMGLNENKSGRHHALSYHSFQLQFTSDLFWYKHFPWKI